eukprot:10822293-Lingulodinium_polyedra.AAC.1
MGKGPKAKQSASKSKWTPPAYSPGDKATAGTRSHRACGIEPSDEWLKAKISECLRNNYGSLTLREQNGETRNGLTLTELLLRDKRTWCLTGQPSLGKPYHAFNRRLYKSNALKLDQLVVVPEHPSNSKDVSDKLMTCLSLLKLPRKPCRIALSQHLASLKVAFSQKE